ncbi:MAG: thymidine phosphorylase [Pseudomonadota bacterium]|jgi:thymidine phosphorylase
MDDFPAGRPTDIAAARPDRPTTAATTTAAAAAPPALPPAEIIRRKRDGQALDDGQIQAFVDGLVAAPGTVGHWGDAQVGALAMATVLRGMAPAETVALTRAMTRSGRVLDWSDAALAHAVGDRGPVLDKHSTGGIGDKVSLVLAPLVAACGGCVPMISGRGLGHTGGTLDKLEALPGYAVDAAPARWQAALREAGCAIIGAGADLAPADRRLYAIRDVTATVESLPLITASILSKKLAAGLQGLVMDVKTGSGAFMARAEDARALARTLVQVAAGAGLRCEARVSDMSQPLGWTAGNALEVAECLDLLCGRAAEPRLRALTLALSARLLCIGGLAADEADAQARLARALDSGAAAERFARMVRSLGGPADVLRDPQLAVAPVVRDVPAPHDGVLAAIDTRAVGLVVVALGGGRARAGQAIDGRVGLSAWRPLGAGLARGEPLCRVHAADAAAAQAAVAALQAACTLAPAGTPVVLPPDGDWVNA